MEHENLNNPQTANSDLGAVMGSQFWHDAKKELPKRTKGSYSDVDVFVCQMYKYTIGRTFNNKWVNMKNEELTDVVLWAHIPEIPKDMHVLLIAHNVISLGEVADFGKINFQLKTKYNAKRKRE